MDENSFENKGQADVNGMLRAMENCLCGGAKQSLCGGKGILRGVRELRWVDECGRGEGGRRADPARCGRMAKGKGGGQPEQSSKEGWVMKGKGNAMTGKESEALGGDWIPND